MRKVKHVDPRSTREGRKDCRERRAARHSKMVIAEKQAKREFHQEENSWQG